MPTVNMSALVPTDADRPPGDRPGERVAGMGIFEGVLGRGRGVPWVRLADREGVCALDGGRDPAREGVLNLELEFVLEKVRGGGGPCCDEEYVVDAEESIGDHGLDEAIETLERLLRPGVLSGGMGGMFPPL